MKWIIASILLTLFSFTNYAQVVLQGEVTDQQGNPLPGAGILLPEQNKGTVSNDNGEYKIENLPQGKIKLRYSFLGFNTEFRTIELQPGGNILNVSLIESVIESQEVVVTGFSISSQHENAVKIDVLKQKKIMLAGTPNFMESLTQIPGVDMIAKGPGVAKPVIRGLSMNNILVLNNGFRIENYQFSENHPLGIDENNIEQVEVIKGPASLLYGSDAIGGILNFITEKAATMGEITGDYQLQFFSNTLGFANSIGLKGASKHFFAGARVGQKSNADYKQGGGNFVPNSRFNEWSLSANAGFFGKKGSSKLNYNYFKQNLGMTVPPVIPLVTEPGRKNNIWYQDLNHHLLSTKNNLYLGRFKWETNIAFQRALRKLQTTLTDPVVEMNLNTITYESKLHFPSNKFSEYILGIQGMSQTNRNQNNRVAQFLPDANVNNLGAMGLGQFTISEKIKIQAGARWDSYKTETFEMGNPDSENYHPPLVKTFSSLNGSAGVFYHISEKVMLRANFAKAYRVPNLSELTSNGMHGNRYEKGNSALQPENAYETDVSIHFHGKFLSFDAACFYNRIKNYIFISPTSEQTPSGIDIYQFSQSNARLTGGEAGVHFHPQTMPWLHLKGIFSSVLGKQENGDFLPFIPAPGFRFEVRAEKDEIAFLKNPNIWVTTLSKINQNHPSPFETVTPGYSLVDAGTNASFNLAKKQIIVSLAVKNIFDTSYIDHLSTLKPLGYQNMGRNISFSLKVLF